MTTFLFHHQCLCFSFSYQEWLPFLILVLILRKYNSLKTLYLEVVQFFFIDKFMHLTLQIRNNAFLLMVKSNLHIHIFKETINICIVEAYQVLLLTAVIKFIK